MFKILHHTFHRQNFFDKGNPGDYFGSSANAPFIEVLRVYLPNPASISIAGSTDENLRMKIPEVKVFQLPSGPICIVLSLNEKGNKLNRCKFILTFILKFAYHKIPDKAKTAVRRRRRATGI
jgi:hypothetical protein